MLDQSPKALPTPLAMSSIHSDQTPSPLPIRSSPPSSKLPGAASRPHPNPEFPTPKLRLKIHDLNHPGANIFFSTTNPSVALASSVSIVTSALYHPTSTNSHIPPTRSITLILRPMPGVAYTTGSSLDSDHKEIHFSLDYIASIPADPPNRQRDEILGVLVHEMVHCWQWNALGTAPGGLIEGVADFVRLKAGLSPPHWRKEGGGDWDAGYQHTGYFLDWVENKWGEGSVRALNEKLRDRKYSEKYFWNTLFRQGVEEMWEEYSESLKEHRTKGQGENEDVEDNDEGVLVERDVEEQELRENYAGDNEERPTPTYII